MTPEQIRVKEWMEAAGFRYSSGADMYTRPAGGNGAPLNVSGTQATFFFRLTLSARREALQAVYDFRKGRYRTDAYDMQKFTHDEIAELDQLLKETT